MYTQSKFAGEKLVSFLLHSLAALIPTQDVLKIKINVYLFPPTGIFLFIIKKSLEGIVDFQNAEGWGRCVEDSRMSQLK